MLDFTVTFAITIINIIILFFILKKILFKPVTKFMEARAVKIQNDIDLAEKDRKDAKALIRQYENALQNAQTEVESIIRTAREQAVVQADQILADGKQAADALLVNARRQIALEEKAALVLFKAEAAQLIISASSRLLQRNLNQEDSRSFAALLLREVADGTVREK
jgi:F-type H+-transporting ATPase subunit b